MLPVGPASSSTLGMEEISLRSNENAILWTSLLTLFVKTDMVGSRGLGFLSYGEGGGPELEVERGLEHDGKPSSLASLVGLL